MLFRSSANAGEPLATEREALATHCRPGQAERAWAAWNDAALTFQASDGEDYTHDTIAEDVVFAIMDHDLGFRLDMDMPGYEDILDRPVQKVATLAAPPARRKWWKRISS